MLAAFDCGWRRTAHRLRVRVARATSRPGSSQDAAGAAAQLLSEAIQINTVNPPGNERPLAELLVDVRPSRRARGPGHRRPPRRARSAGRAAAWARLPGTGKPTARSCCSRISTSSRAEPNGWAVDPFGGLVAGGYVVGRGASTPRGSPSPSCSRWWSWRTRRPSCSRVTSSSSRRPTRRPADARRRIHRAAPPRAARGAEFLLTEGGGILLGEGRQRRTCGACRSSRRRPVGRDSRPAARPATHRPAGRTAPCRVWSPRSSACAAWRRRCAWFRRSRDMFAEFVPLAEPADRAGLGRSRRRARITISSFRRRFLADEARAALVRNTVAVTVLQAGTSPNVVPERGARRTRRAAVARRALRRIPRATARACSRTRASASSRSSPSRRAPRPADTKLFEAIDQVALRDRSERRRDPARDRRLHRRPLLPRARHRRLRVRAALAAAERDARHPRPERARLGRESRTRHRTTARILEVLGTPGAGDGLPATDRRA